MSIFSFFFTGKAKNALEAKNDTVPPNFPRLRPGTILRVSTADGPLFSGSVSRFSRTGLTLSIPPLPCPPCAAQTAVSLELEGSNNVFCLRGTVELIDGEKCRLAAVELLPRAGASFTPLFTEIPAAVCEENDESFARPQPCTLIQADRSGFTFHSEFPRFAAERVRVAIFIENCFPLTMRGRIVRVEMSAAGVFRFLLRSDGLEEFPGQ